MRRGPSRSWVTIARPAPQRACWARHTPGAGSRQSLFAAANNVFLRNMNTDVPLAGARRVEVFRCGWAETPTDVPGTLGRPPLQVGRRWREVSGRLTAETVTFLRLLADARVGFARLRTGLLAVAAQCAYASSLRELVPDSRLPAGS